MDPFSKLPPLVQAEIFVHIESEASIMQLIQASPVIGSLFTTRKTTIVQRILMNFLAGDTNGRILQDALAILNFPYANGVSSMRSIRRHIEQWAAQGFNDPFQQYNRNIILTLWRLFSRLVMFIEDYLAKATDPFPPCAYLALPGITSTGLRFKGKPIDVEPVMFTALTSSERRRFLRAFLRYELLCKVYHPRVWNSIEQSSSASQVKFMHETLQPTEHKALHCVHQYFKGVYGAIFAHFQDSWLPDRPAPDSAEPSFSPVSAQPVRHKPTPETKHGLLYPDTVYFSAEDYLKSMDIRCEELADILPCLGLDLLTQMLTALGEHQESGQYLKKWLRAFSNERRKWRFCAWILLPHFSIHHQQSATYEPNIYRWGLRQGSPHRPSKVPTIQRYLEWDRIGWRKQRKRQLEIHAVQLRIYRQRAWAFFDDARLYPDAISHFPTMDDLDEQDQMVSNRLAPAYERERRRSQKWQDYYSGRNLDRPFDREEDEKEEAKTLEDEEARLKRFFEKPARGKIVTFWRHDIAMEATSLVEH
ncbi:hypothetical protein ACHAPT_012245 [Fusarium lateritium]